MRFRREKKYQWPPVKSFQDQQLSLLGPVEYWRGYAASRLNVDPGQVVGVSLAIGGGGKSIARLADGRTLEFFSP